MFKIKSTRLMEWPGYGFTLRRGDNELESRSVVPDALRPKLLRFRALKLLEFEGDFGEQALKETAKLADLTEVQLFAKDKVALAELAKAEGVSVPEGASKTELLKVLVPKAKPLPKLEQPAPEAKPEGEGEKKPGAKKAAQPAGQGARA